jgi:hypothetical protein
LCFKTSSEPIEFIDNYCDGGYIYHGNLEKTAVMEFEHFEEDKKQEDSKMMDFIGTEGIMMERGTHYCHWCKDFELNFKKMYEENDLRLFNNRNMDYKMTNELESKEKLRRFFEEIGTGSPSRGIRRK